MSTLILLAWMAIVSAIISQGAGFHGTIFFILTQSTCMIAGMVEAGTIETKRDSIFRMPTRAMALCAFSGAVIVRAFFPGV